MTALEDLGWSASWEEVFAPYRAEGFVPARVAAQERDSYTLYATVGEWHATIAGRLRHRASQTAELPVTGDWVAATPPVDDGPAIIRAVLPRASRFSRKIAGKVTAEQILAANIDVVFLVSAFAGDLNVRRLERALTLAWESGAEPVIVLSKADLAPERVAEEDEIESIGFGVPVLRVSALAGTGLDAMRSHILPGRTAALLGSSGVGKSTLVNALLGENRQQTAAVRSDGKGRHTTTRRELILLPSGGLLLDTPGLRELQLWAGEEVIGGVFEEIGQLAEHCRFADCVHETEPGCAVFAAVADGRLDPARLASYRKLRAEAAYLETKVDERAREERNRLDRALHRAARAHIKRKYQ